MLTIILSRYNPLLLLSLFFFLTVIPTTVSSQTSDDGSWRLEEHWYNHQLEPFRYPPPFRTAIPHFWNKNDERPSANLNEPYLENALRLGGFVGGGMNYHDAEFNLPGYSFFNTTISPSSVSFSVPSVSIGIAAELPITEFFAVGLRLYQSTQSASLVMKASSFSYKFDASLTTITSEALGVFSFGENWRTYLGFAVSGVVEKQYIYPNSLGNLYASPSHDILAPTRLMASPLVGVGYDIPLTQRTSPFEGRWVLTPELMGMLGLNQILENLSASERWSISQLRIGINISYQWHGKKPSIIQ